MRDIFYPSLVSIALLATIADDAKAPVELTLSTPSSTYVLGEPIPVSLVLRVLDSIPRIQYRLDLRNFHSQFTVVNPAGEPVRRLTDRSNTKGSLDWQSISMRSQVLESADLTEIYDEPYASPYPHLLNLPGVYEVTFSGAAAFRDLDGNLLYEKVLRTEPLRIRLSVPTNEDLERAVMTLGDLESDAASRMAALRKIRYGGAPSAQILEALVDFVSRATTPERLVVVRTFGEMGSEKALNALITVLQGERDEFVRAEGMNALGRYDNAESRRLLVEEVVAKRARSYRAAVVVLGIVGDESSIEVLEDVAVHDETEWVRERARDSAQSILRRINERRRSVPRGSPNAP